jgi:hypothetical protein
MTRGVVSNWEQGVFLPPADKREKIAHVLGLNSKAVERAASNRGPSWCAKAPAQPSARVTNRQIEPHKHRAAGCIARNRFAIFPATTLDRATVQRLRGARWRFSIGGAR